jgi:hypothetical protein
VEFHIPSTVSSVERRSNGLYRVGHRAQFLDGQALQAGERSDKFAKRQFLLVGDEKGATTLTAPQGALNSFDDIVDMTGVKGIPASSMMMPAALM